MTIKTLLQSLPAKKQTDTEHPAEREVGDDFNARLEAITEARGARVVSILAQFSDGELPGTVHLIVENLTAQLVACADQASATKDKTERWFYTVDQHDQLLAHHSAEAVALLNQSN